MLGWFQAMIATAWVITLAAAGLIAAAFYLLSGLAP
jgi:phosphate/sulfate permease